ncbi:hypothetical protein NsoK4_00480 [Nitrosopumilus sp. K4]|uniref:hypothetical protein n=1 Tax=Nitrosopumilus sp. K4 TaxID=2795383 RepID=UPI001BAA4024|nr:hypothetical protein [Nitrosopumilus sp. K4]QUC64800.1 hypothetical protein NsoK4_00480 [Nitrosopumilus sp. K4]
MIGGKYKFTIFALPVFVIMLFSFAFVSASNFEIVSPAIADGDWQTIQPASVEVTKNGNNNALSLKTISNIPNVERNVYAGFGWVYEDDSSAYVVTTHNGVKDSKQNPNGWHTHNISYEPVAIPASVTHCITTITDDIHAGVIIQKDSLRVNVRESELSTFMDPLKAISFDIVPDPTCPLGVGIGILQEEVSVP